jgi:RNA 3'-terminal phosphate cyclase
VVWAESEKGLRVGADSLGERGKSAERVGGEAASQLVEEVSTGMSIDSHLCDMLIPYLAVADGDSKFGVTEVTSHLVTNIWVVERILGTEIKLEGKVGDSGTVSIKGEGMSL